jgi:cold-inducible RNA-binding protein
MWRCSPGDPFAVAARAHNTPSSQAKYVMAVRLFIGNLPYDVTEAELRAHFAAVGPLVSLALPTDRDTGRPRGLAFVEFSERADAEAAIRHLNHQAFKGRLLAVSEARARDDRVTTSPPRTTAPRALISTDTSVGDRRPFGPDAAPRRRRTPTKGAVKAHRGPKRPMYKRATGPVHFGAEDDDADEEARGEHGASRQANAVDYDTA